MKHSFKWLAQKIDANSKEVRLNFKYFKENVQNIPFAVLHLENEAIENEQMVLLCLLIFTYHSYSK